MLLLKILSILLLVAFIIIMVFFVKKRIIKENQIEINNSLDVIKKEDFEKVDNLSIEKTEQQHINPVISMNIDMPFAYWFVTITNIEAFARAFNENSYAARYTDDKIEVNAIAYKDMGGIYNDIKEGTHLYVWVVNESNAIIARGDFNYTNSSSIKINLM